MIFTGISLKYITELTLKNPVQKMNNTYSEDDVEDNGGGWNKNKEKNLIFFMKMAGRSEIVNKTFYFYSKSQLLDVGGFAKQGIKKYLPRQAMEDVWVEPLPIKPRSLGHTQHRSRI
jgi:hypothetical protein